MRTRRSWLGSMALAGVAAGVGCARWGREKAGLWVNDVHARINRTYVRQVVEIDSTDAAVEAVRQAAHDGHAVSVMGGRHAMGGQQFGSHTVLLDMNPLAGVVELDTERGEVEVLAGTQWPELVRELARRQGNEPGAWGIRQKQSGADRLTIGGGLAANVHSRSLISKPMVDDVEAFTIVTADGSELRCSRRENADLFRVAIGGYGLVGVITSVKLRLARREVVERVVEITTTDGIMSRFDERIADGFHFGDCQFATDVMSDDALHRAVFSCYRPVSDGRLPSDDRVLLGPDDWLELVALAHEDRKAAFDRYATHYRSTTGQLYFSDLHQMAGYVDDYHHALAHRLGEAAQGSEMITELYVPRESLNPFLNDVRADMRARDMNLIYGTIRVVERDDETLLSWAREPWACIIFNLHTQHDDAALEKTAEDFRRLIDHARRYGGSYFLTYHKWATRDQVLACHPTFPEFLRQKKRFDPQDRFQSEWYRHHRDLLS